MDVRLGLASDSQTGTAKRIGSLRVQSSKRGIELADPPDMGDSPIRVTPERFDTAELENSRQRVRRSSGSGIEIGVSDCQIHARADEAVGPGLGRPAGLDPVRRFEEQRVIGDQKINGITLEVPNHGLGDFMTHPNRIHGRLCVSQLNTHGVPGGRRLWFRSLGDGVDDVVHIGHRRDRIGNP